MKGVKSPQSEGTIDTRMFHFGAVVAEALRIPLPSLLSLPVCATMLDFPI